MGDGRERRELNSVNLSKEPLLCAAAAAKSLQSCPALRDPTDGSPPGSPVPGILMNGLIFYKSLIKAVCKSLA